MGNILNGQSRSAESGKECVRRIKNLYSEILALSFHDTNADL